MSLKSVIKQPEGYALWGFWEAGKKKLIDGCVLIQSLYCNVIIQGSCSGTGMRRFRFSIPQIRLPYLPLFV